jgi:SAM-dependent methyltransferase
MRGNRRESNTFASRAGAARVIPVVRILVLAASIGFLVWLLAQTDLRLPATSGELFPSILVAYVLLLMAVISLSALWGLLLRYRQGPGSLIRWSTTFRAFARSWLARYLPGSVWAYGARFIYADPAHVPRQTIALSLVDEFLLVTGTAAVLGLSAWLWSSFGTLAGLAGLMTSMVALASTVAWVNPVTHSLLEWVTSRLRRQSSEPEPSPALSGRARLTVPVALAFATGYLATNASTAGAFAIGVATLTPGTGDDVALFVAGYSVASLVGMVVIFAPAGIGVREATIVGLLAPSVGADAAAAAAVAVRLGMGLADLTVFAAAEVWGASRPVKSLRRSRMHNTSERSKPARRSPIRLGSLYRSLLLQHLGLTEEEGRVIDIGGFDGHFAAQLPRRGAVVADIEPLGVYDRPLYVKADARRLPFPDGSFDCAFALDLIEHLDDDRGAIAEALRVLRPGGRLILSTPDADIRIFPPFLQSRIDLKWGHHRVRGYRREELSRLFDSTLTENVRITNLRTGALRSFYLPLSVLWRLPGPLGRWLVRLVARWDSRHLVGHKGYLLAYAVRAPEDRQPRMVKMDTDAHPGSASWGFRGGGG